MRPLATVSAAEISRFGPQGLTGVGALQVSGVYEIYEASDQCNLFLQLRSIEVSLNWRVFLASGQEGHSVPARTNSFTSGFRNGRHMQKMADRASVFLGFVFQWSPGVRVD